MKCTLSGILINLPCYHGPIKAKFGLNIHLILTCKKTHLVVTLYQYLSHPSLIFFCFGRKNVKHKKEKEKNAEKTLSKQLLIMVRDFW